MFDSFFNKYKKVFAGLFIVGILCVVMPIVVACGYTYLCEDDFSFEGGAADAVDTYGSNLVASAHKMVQYYNINQGTYLFNFLIHFIRAYARGGLPGFHFFMIMNTVVFCLALILLLRILTRENVAYLGIALAVFVSILSMRNTEYGKELFFWYTGGLNYLTELALGLIAVSLCILYIRKKKVGYLIASAIIAFLASGGSLNVVCADLSWLIAVVILKRDEFIKDKKIAIPAAVSFVGTLINGVAPGNYKRAERDLKEGHSTFFDALRDAFKCVISEDKLLFTSAVFVLMLLFVFLLCIIYKVKVLEGKVTVLNLVIVVVGAWLSRYFTMFPVTYGYHSDTMVSMRTVSSYEIVAKFMYFLVVAVLAQFVSEKFEGKTERIAIGVSAVIVLVALILHGGIQEEYKNGLSYYAYNDYKTGALQENYAAREYVLSSLRLAEKDSDAVVYVRPFRLAASCYGMGLDVESDAWVNRSAAGFFDLHTVTIVYLDE
ncbi:MAG: hypothetical protein J5504_07585 [Butyrivibrio sp.]|nr:hypothetical protein [Butyrivibrio sp.]